MKKNRKEKISEDEIRETIAENEVINNNLFDDPEDDYEIIDNEDEELNDLLRKLDNITDAYRDENENPFYYFLNMHTY